MQTTLKFICCSDYDFVNQETGERITGIAFKCFEPNSKKIVKVKTDCLIDGEFGDDVLVNVVINGNYLNYEIA